MLAQSLDPRWQVLSRGRVTLRECAVPRSLQTCWRDCWCALAVLSLGANARSPGAYERAGELAGVRSLYLPLARMRGPPEPTNVPESLLVRDRCNFPFRGKLVGSRMRVDGRGSLQGHIALKSGPPQEVKRRVAPVPGAGLPVLQSGTRRAAGQTHEVPSWRVERCSYQLRRAVYCGVASKKFPRGAILDGCRWRRSVESSRAPSAVLQKGVHESAICFLSAAVQR
ncbi:hypothetical protein NDU88_008765 [Pleurodeles waltl]|uniref:Uncharacterized protein n=1 Tax=Pleurodeles waltl TaxID=8319 RepID=A0AAV7QQW2_PLEWA|nr:hypothetical protein NDU88_008765 [Pleurodeles waltl]